MKTPAINQITNKALDKITKTNILSNFYLAGGTGLAIHLQHRESIDLDWFSNKQLDNDRIKKSLAQIGKFELTSEDENTINGLFDAVKISFFNYQYNLLFPLVKFNGIHVADQRDIAAMKINAASQRGSKKDFIDIYFLMKKYSLSELIQFFENKYHNIKFNKLHILKSLVFFEDANNEPEPIMIKKATWDEVKRHISKEVKKYL